jgi:tetrahydromethanopterin S-methyltransferase subunit G
MEAMEAPSVEKGDVALIRAYIVEEINCLASRLQELHESIDYDMSTVEKRVGVGRAVPLGVLTAKLAVDYNLTVARIAVWQRALELLDDPSELRPKPAPAPETKKSRRKK